MDDSASPPLCYRHTFISPSLLAVTTPAERTRPPGPTYIVPSNLPLAPALHGDASHADARTLAHLRSAAAADASSGSDAAERRSASGDGIAVCV